MKRKRIHFNLKLKLETFWLWNLQSLSKINCLSYIWANIDLISGILKYCIQLYNHYEMLKAYWNYEIIQFLTDFSCSTHKYYFLLYLSTSLLPIILCFNVRDILLSLWVISCFAIYGHPYITCSIRNTWVSEAMNMAWYNLRNEHKILYKYIFFIYSALYKY